ncbi:conjugal transfer pilus assembly protein TraU [Novosphingobium chloroacetimidivorans]|uniref:Conjugal transfer pilus assembly protein TraU n=1 Tax=Novosphingobium chloroacetimidivorans TaxID=1428314 RepID=A0A7W7KCZ7_9SPHN|nr:conjugal transfer pilus assembly protein TraU [Novosphingobium chloroacetimidivorans]MBB4860537.1 conjugal transfer pilus assembly protein TraU [Novosphingobium chloroacetimidivorans]
MRKLLLVLFAMASFWLTASAASAQVPARCTGKFVNPITDVCWGCLFPLSIGALKIWPSDRADTDNPNLPICFCGSPIPRVGVAAGFWEPVRLIDVTTKPFCFPNLGGVKLSPGFQVGNGYVSSSSQIGGRAQNTAKYHVHYYVYPLLYWMEILADFLCFEQASFDIAYMTEIDPLWQEDALTTIINPEAVIFSHPLAQAACAADCVASTAKLPLDALFWCSGCNGSMYPMNGNVGANVGMEQSTRLAAERMIYKMHRQGLAWGTMGSKGLCNKYVMPILKKQQYRLQMVNPSPMVSGREACAPIGTSTILPQTGRVYPVIGEDVGYLLWRKRNCCVL